MSAVDTKNVGLFWEVVFGNSEQQ